MIATPAVSDHDICEISVQLLAHRQNSIEAVQVLRQIASNCAVGED